MGKKKKSKPSILITLKWIISQKQMAFHCVVIHCNEVPCLKCSLELEQLLFMAGIPWFYISFCMHFFSAVGADNSRSVLNTPVWYQNLFWLCISLLDNSDNKNGIINNMKFRSLFVVLTVSLFYACLDLWSVTGLK